MTRLSILRSNLIRRVDKNLKEKSSDRIYMIMERNETQKQGKLCLLRRVLFFFFRKALVVAADGHFIGSGGKTPVA